MSGTALRERLPYPYRRSRAADRDRCFCLDRKAQRRRFGILGKDITQLAKHNSQNPRRRTARARVHPPTRLTQPALIDSLREWHR